MLPKQPQFLSNQPKNLMQHFHLPGDALQDIWSKFADFYSDTQCVLLWKYEWTTTDHTNTYLTFGKRGPYICAHALIFFQLCILITHYIQTMKMYLSN